MGFNNNDGLKTTLRTKGTSRMVNLKREIENDIERYLKILEQYRSGTLKTGEVEGQSHLIDKTSEVARHLENVISELRAFLRDG
jgi:hypothetical protein